ncbi:MAG: hypothetical protein ACK5Q5_17270 [Planctomycetaceae bacterium]
MSDFQDLIDSRKSWIAEVLIPWCRQAELPELRKAADEWFDIAGRIEPDFSLWLWAWSRFPCLYVEGLQGLDETYEVHVTLRDGRRFQGFPNARESRRGVLVLQTLTGPEGPWRLDEVQSVERSTPS